MVKEVVIARPAVNKAFKLLNRLRINLCVSNEVPLIYNALILAIVASSGPTHLNIYLVIAKIKEGSFRFDGG